jgi:hypothetical protein
VEGVFCPIANKNVRGIDPVDSIIGVSDCFRHFSTGTELEYTGMIQRNFSHLCSKTTLKSLGEIFNGVRATLLSI